MMKNSLSKLSVSRINEFDKELMKLVKTDLQDQSEKMASKLIHLTTIKFDTELFQIIKQDIQIIKEQLYNLQRTLAKAG